MLINFQMRFNFICNSCGHLYNPGFPGFVCKCGGLLGITNLSLPSVSNNTLPVDKRFRGVGRYLPLLPISEAPFSSITMGEGDTPLIEVERGLMAKLDYMMPTLSFKDRGAAVLISYAKEYNIKQIIQDSSGNAGCSVAAYSARAGIDARIFLGSSTPKKKIDIITRYGAKVEAIEGSREDVAAAAFTRAAKNEEFYASHVYNPLFAQGMKSYLYEIFEQLNGVLNINIFLPLGNGTIVIGTCLAIKELMVMGLLRRIPQIVAIQADNCAPIYNAVRKGVELTASYNHGTAADGIAIVNPARGPEIIGLLEELNGDIISVTEDEILKAHNTLSRKGFNVEVTSAVNYAGYKKYINSSTSRQFSKSIITLCGSTK